MGILDSFIESFTTGYREVTGVLPFSYSSLLNVFIFAILIAFYSIFTYRFYSSLSKKDLIELNLSQYNKTTYPALNKTMAAVLYLVEYIIVLPILIFFWFVVLALIILMLSEEHGINQVIIISAAMVTAIRILAYYTEDLSKDLAKIFPFTVLTIFLLNPGFFSLERVLINLNQVPQFLTNILFFLILIIALEFILRLIDIAMNFFRNSGSGDSESSSK